MSQDVIVTAADLQHRTILRRDLKADRAAFLDTKIPGSEAKINYPLIGPGVSENPDQAVPVTEPHGFNLGGAVMPAGVINNLHLHFTAEVFVCFAGEWLFRWGVHGDDGTAVVSDGDVISIPTWIFRGFTSQTDDAWLFTALGRDESGGLIWAPSVMAKAADVGTFLTADNRLVQTEPGKIPAGVILKDPLNYAQLQTLAKVSTEEMRARLAQPGDLAWSSRAFLDSQLPGGGADFAPVVGYGLSEDRVQLPRLTNPHGLCLGWLRAQPGSGMNLHRVAPPEVLIVKTGTLRVTLNRADPVSVDLGPYDTLSIPGGAWRQFESVGSDVAQVVVITSGDGRVRIDWDPAVVLQARGLDVAIDPNGYVAPASMLNR